MDLEEVSLVGRKQQPLRAEIVRELTEADLALLATERGVKPQTVKKLRDSHHAVARCVAQGLTGAETSAITGYTESRVSVLKADPAFQELVAFYAARLDEINEAVYADSQTKIAALKSDVIDELADRLDTEPEKIATETLLDALKITADRTGDGPSTKSTNINVNLDLADRIARGRQRAQRTIAAVPSAVALPGGADAEASLPASAPAKADAA